MACSFNTQVNTNAQHAQIPSVLVSGGKGITAKQRTDTYTTLKIPYCTCHAYNFSSYLHMWLIFLGVYSEHDTMTFKGCQQLSWDGEWVLIPTTFNKIPDNPDKHRQALSWDRDVSGCRFWLPNRSLSNQFRSDSTNCWGRKWSLFHVSDWGGQRKGEVKTY